MVKGSCPNRAESAAMNDLSRSLVLVNYFRDLPNFPEACKDNSAQLLGMLDTCHAASGGRWPNFIAVDFYKVSHPCQLPYDEYEHDEDSLNANAVD